MWRIIHISPEMQVGTGSYGNVYRVSQTEVVKVMHEHRNEHICSNYMREHHALMEREIEGSFQPDATPVLDIVKVVMPDGKETIGLLKPFIPYPINGHLWSLIKDRLRERNPLLAWDLSSFQVRLDDDGRPWIVDTAVSRSWCSAKTHHGLVTGLLQNYKVGIWQKG